MRILAAHDTQGGIQHIVVCPADSPCPTVTAETGLLVTEVEVPEELSGFDPSDPENHQRLAEVLQNLQDFQIEGALKAKLVRRTSEASY
jgi:hypothetical protein